MPYLVSVVSFGMLDFGNPVFPTHVMTQTVSPAILGTIREQGEASTFSGIDKDDVVE